MEDKNSSRRVHRERGEFYENDKNLCFRRTRRLKFTNSQIVFKYFFIKMKYPSLSVRLFAGWYYAKAENDRNAGEPPAV